MSQILFESPRGRVPRWRVTCHPFGGCDPWLVAFEKWGRTTKVVDKIARWTGSSWDPSRWVPDQKVPRDVMRSVIGELLRLEVQRGQY